MRLHRKPRRGTALVECAFILPIAMLLMIGMLVGGLGVFRYEQMAAIARESSRYAAVHGAQYAQDTGNAAATPQDIYNNVIAPRSAGLDQSQLTYSVTWNTDNYPYHTTIVNGQIVPVTNTVTVTITYKWLPEAFLGGMTMTSTSAIPMSY